MVVPQPGDFERHFRAGFETVGIKTLLKYYGNIHNIQRQTRFTAVDGVSGGQKSLLFCVYRWIGSYEWKKYSFLHYLFV